LSVLRSIELIKMDDKFKPAVLKAALAGLVNNFLHTGCVVHVGRGS